ncbi:MAG: phosphate ABC transporter permease PstA [Gammaproteobacteria bacterium]|nr:phosphate ABC transporter permease PstA [Gammaproteobacteria bacterium]MCY4276595.1 phosphate ABC transporter permease PstA [Gammaproteobacteria bacterium]
MTDQAQATGAAAANWAVWWHSGKPLIWLNALAVALSISAVVGLLALLAVRGLAYFWPAEVLEFDHLDNGAKTRVVGELVAREFTASADQHGDTEQWLLKTGNRRANPPDFRWYARAEMSNVRAPPDLVVIERREWGRAYGRLRALYEGDARVASGERVWPAIEARYEQVQALRDAAATLQSTGIDAINYELEELRLDRRRREFEALPPSLELVFRERELKARYAEYEARLGDINAALDRDSLHLDMMNDEIIELPLGDLLRIWRPNQMSWREKLRHYFVGVGLFLTEGPREANTEGGVFPAIFGTALMVMLMSIVVTPFGVLAALYLREYARQGPLVRVVRIAVNNLAGVPSIVYGVFGLGFFVYFIGGSIDDLFYAHAAPAPTFGTPGLIWASLTLALLTAPVVIVATEEGLARIPRSIREGSLALGATKAETLLRVILPMASPSILTGIILAVARAAGEVAPLMLVGVVKLAPTLPIDGHFPYIHLERKFMHLGFHIYDLGFQSPNVEAARPLVFATALLLVVVILLLNTTAILLRGRLERRYRSSYQD